MQPCTAFLSDNDFTKYTNQIEHKPEGPGNPVCPGGPGIPGWPLMRSTVPTTYQDQEE